MWIKEFTESISELSAKFANAELILLTESDLKGELSAIFREKVASNVTVNTESPWYDTYETNSTYYVDITAYDRDKLQITYDPQLNRKGYKYEDEAIAAELKYFRHRADITEVASDFNKMRLFLNAPKNYCFIVAGARTKQLFEEAKIFMQQQAQEYQPHFKERVWIYLFGPDELTEIISQ
jgi:hypothetical protein